MNDIDTANGSSDEPISSPALEAYQETARRNLELRKEEVALCLSLSGVARVNIRYDGCGDSGQIEEVLNWDEQGQQITRDLSNATTERLTDFFYDLIEVRHPGWEDNDGAFGDFQWDLREDSLVHTHHTRFTDLDTTEYEGL